MLRDILFRFAGCFRAGHCDLFCLAERAGLLLSRGTAHLVDRRVLKPFATMLVYVERTQSGLHFVTRIPDANAMRILQGNDAQAP
jgi:hypothetical protein